jgi:hypothetical protein
MTVRDWLADGLILLGALCVLAGVYLLLGLAVALIAMGCAVVFVGVRMG